MGLYSGEWKGMHNEEFLGCSRGLKMVKWFYFSLIGSYKFGEQ